MTFWVRVTSHRARGQLKRILGDEFGASYGSLKQGWPPRGEYRKVSERHRSAITGIKGLTVLKGAPANDAELFQYLTWR